MTDALFDADLSAAPLGMLVSTCIRVCPGPDGEWVSVVGRHVGAGLVLHLDPAPHPENQPPWWHVTDAATGMYVSRALDPLRAIVDAYRRLILTRGRPSDLDGSVQDAVRAILVRARLALPAALRPTPPEA